MKSRFGGREHPSKDAKKLYFKSKRSAREMALLVKALVSKPTDLSSIPRTHMVERENQFLQAVPWLLNSHTRQNSKPQMSAREPVSRWPWRIVPENQHLTLTAHRPACMHACICIHGEIYSDFYTYFSCIELFIYSLLGCTPWPTGRRRLKVRSVEVALSFQRSIELGSPGLCNKQLFFVNKEATTKLT